jgi:hypothetical protein
VPDRLARPANNSELCSVASHSLAHPK